MLDQYGMVRCIRCNHQIGEGWAAGHSGMCRSCYPATFGVGYKPDPFDVGYSQASTPSDVLTKSTKPILRCPKGAVIRGFIDGKIEIFNPTSDYMTIVHRNGNCYHIQPEHGCLIPTWDYDPDGNPGYRAPANWRVSDVNIWVDDRPAEMDTPGTETISKSRRVIYETDIKNAAFFSRKARAEIRKEIAGDAGSAGEAGQAGTTGGCWSYPHNIKPGSTPDDWKALQIAALNSGEIDALNGGNRPSARPCVHEGRVFIETREDGTCWLRFCAVGGKPAAPVPYKWSSNMVTLKPGPKITTPGRIQLWGQVE